MNSCTILLLPFNSHIVLTVKLHCCQYNIPIPERISSTQLIVILFVRDIAIMQLIERMLCTENFLFRRDDES